MNDSPEPVAANDEGGLRAPPHLKGWRKAWWWFDFIILVKLARLRFIAVLVVIGAAITQWDLLVAYYEKYTRPAGEASAAAGGDVEWFCPMHPSVVRDNSREKCPICFMPLSKRKKGQGTVEALPAGVVSRVQLSPYRVVLAGVQTWSVDYVPLTKRITAVGYVDFDERAFRTVAARVKGRIDSLISAETGKLVIEGDELAAIYSPDLNVTVQAMVDAQKRNNAESVKSSRNRLELLGISNDQIEEILASGKTNTHLRIRSPISGHIVKKYVREGQYIEEGMPLYDIANLTSVWIQAQVYESDFAFLPAEHHGDVAAEQLAVTATTLALPDEPVKGILSFVYPHVDQETRTITVRFDVQNPGHRLRPGSTAEVMIDVPPSRVTAIQRAVNDNDAAGEALATGKVLAIPERAVIDTGRQQVVYRRVASDTFEGVSVQLGPRMQSPEGVTYYPVLSGLKQGETIVTSGSFLVDAETRLNPAAGSIYIGGSSGSSAVTAKTVRPSTPEETELQSVAGKSEKIAAALAKLAPADRELAAKQKNCVILKNSPLGSMGVPIKLKNGDETVFLCCAACVDAALKKFPNAKRVDSSTEAKSP